MTALLEQYNYAVVIILMMTGLYVVFASTNLIKKLVGLSVFQTSVFLLYITMSKVAGGKPPIITLDKHDGGHGAAADSHGASYDVGHKAVETVSHHGADALAHSADTIYSNPLPHVLILTAIVVGVATLAVGLALVVRIRESYGTIEEAEIDKINYAFNLEGVAAPADEGES